MYKYPELVEHGVKFSKVIIDPSNKTLTLDGDIKLSDLDYNSEAIPLRLIVEMKMSQRET